MKTLLDFYDDIQKEIFGFSTVPFSGAIFTDIEARHGDVSDIFNSSTATTLDIDYILNHSGRKPITPLLYDMMYGDRQPTPVPGSTKAEEVAAYVADICYAMYANKWKKLFDALEVEYNPIENYSMTEKTIKDETTTTFGKHIDDEDTTAYGKKNNTSNEITYGKKDDVEVTTEYGKTTITDDDVTYGHTTRKDGTQTDTEQISPGISTTNTHDVYAYNEQSTASHESKDTESRSGTDNRTVTTDYNAIEDSESGTDERDIRVGESGQDVVTTGETQSGKDTTAIESRDSGSDVLTKKYKESGDEVQSRDYEFTRSGNVGVTTSQQMIESEWELRKHLLYEQMMKDVDNVLVLSCY